MARAMVGQQDDLLFLQNLVSDGTLEEIQEILEVVPEDLLNNNQYIDYLLVLKALEKQRIDVAHFLIDKGFRIYKDYRLQIKKTPLHCAVALGNMSLVKKILDKERSHNIWIPDKRGQTPIHLAIERNHSEILQLFLLTFDVVTLYNQFLLHYAVERNKPEIVCLLLRAGFSVVDKNPNEETPFCIAIRKNESAILNLLWSSYDLNNFRHGSYANIALTYIASITGNVDFLKKSISTGFPINRPIQSCPDDWSVLRNCSWSTLFSLAVKHVQLETVKFLLEIGVDFNRKDKGIFPICLAVKAAGENVWENQLQLENNNKIIEEILRASVKLNAYVSTEQKVTYFLIGCIKDRPDILEHFLKNNLEPNNFAHLIISPHNGYSPLHLAAKYGCKKNAEMLLKYGANVDHKGFQKITPLHIAVQESSVEVVELLVKHGANVFNEDAHGNTPVHSAFLAKKYAILDLLLSLQTITDSNPINAEGISHFHIACTRNNANTVESFLKSGVNVNRCVPVDSKFNYLEHYNDCIWHGYSPLHFAVSFNQSKIAQLLLSYNANVDIRNSIGFTPLHLACQYLPIKFQELIQNSLEGTNQCKSQESTDLNSKRKMKKHKNQFDGSSTAIKIIDWSANRKEHIKIINLLIKHRSNVNYLDEFGNGSLFHACFLNVNRIIDTIHDQVHFQTIFTDQILTCLSKEMGTRRSLILEILFQANVNSDKCYNHSSILHYICQSMMLSDDEKLELAEVFLQKGADVNVKNIELETPLHSAVKAMDEKLVGLFLNYNADVDSVNSQHCSTPLHIATSHQFCAKSAAIIKLLIDKNSNVNLKQSDGTTPLHNLVSQSLSDCSEFEIMVHGLVKIGGADVNSQDSNGRTPLFMACAHKNEAVGSLIDCGADVNIEDCHGKNVLYYIYKHQAKPLYLSNQLLDDNLITMLEALYNHLIKLTTMGLYVSKEVLIYKSKLRVILKYNLFEYLDQDEEEKINECKEEIEVMKNTQIDSNNSLYDIMFKDESAMTKHIKNDTLRNIVQSSDFSKKFNVYGNILELKCMNGLKRLLYMPCTKFFLNFLSGLSLPEICSENILKHLTNFELKIFLDSTNLAFFGIKRSKIRMPLRIRRNCTTKYQRIK